MNRHEKIGIITGGGDCGGQNAVIKGAIDRCAAYGFEIVPLAGGWEGLVNYQEADLQYNLLETNFNHCGTLIGTSRTNPYNSEGSDISRKVVDNILENEFDGLIVNGGDDTLSVVSRLYQEHCTEGGLLEHVIMIGVPKTMDGDIQSYSVGLQTAIEHAADAIYCLKTTAESTGRISIVELFGRDAGHTAFYSGIAAGADIILVPEIGFSAEKVAGYAMQKLGGWKKSLTIVVSEGAAADELGGQVSDDEEDSFGHRKLGGIGGYIQQKLKEKGIESNLNTFTYLMRSGRSCAYDNYYGITAGKAAVDLIKYKEKNGVSVVDVQRGDIITMPIEDVIKMRMLDMGNVLFHCKETYFGRSQDEIRRIADRIADRI